MLTAFGCLVVMGVTQSGCKSLKSDLVFITDYKDSNVAKFQFESIQPSQ